MQAPKPPSGWSLSDQGVIRLGLRTPPALCVVHCPDGSNSCQIDWPKRNGCGAQAIPSLFFWEGDDLPQPNWLDFQRMQNGCHSANLSLLRWSATPSEWLRMQPSLCYPSQLPRRLAGTFDSGVGCHDVPCISIGYVHGWPGHFLFHLSSSKFFFSRAVLLFC